MFQILIVEDDKELSQLFRKVLEKNGYQVKCTSDGAQALEVLDKEYIDLIISDIMMPVMDGYELVSELRSAGYQIPHGLPFEVKVDEPNAVTYAAMEAAEKGEDMYGPFDSVADLMEALI